MISRNTTGASAADAFRDRDGRRAAESFGGSAPERGPEPYRLVIRGGTHCCAFPDPAGRARQVHREVGDAGSFVIGEANETVMPLTHVSHALRCLGARRERLAAFL
jgi:hypothetical protein